MGATCVEGDNSQHGQQVVRAVTVKTVSGERENGNTLYLTHQPWCWDRMGASIHDGKWVGIHLLTVRKGYGVASGASICMFDVSDVCSFPASTLHGGPKSNLTNSGKASKVWHCI